ncbi:MAG: ABC transporter ATP-binding protein [Planctomycetota bacterium]|jgi:heme exporter protein A
MTGHPAQTATAVRTDQLGKVIDDKPILVDVTFAVPTGGFTALLGANGAGKSTLLKVLTALTPATSGTIELFGEPLRLESAAVRARLGMIGHASMLYRDLSPLENLLFFGRLYDLPDPRGRAREMLELVDLFGRRHDPVKTLSRGMIQRVAIARALMHDPDLLLADEPFAGLDAPSRHMLEQMLARLNDAGKTILLVNHDIEQTLAIARHVVVLRGGRVIIDESADRLDAPTVLEQVTSGGDVPGRSS